MRILLRGLAVAVATLAVVLPGGRAAASAITLIKYDLSGTVAYFGGAVVNPVFSPDAPGPGGVGSTVTFRFAPLPSSGTSVQILTFVQSDALTLTSLGLTGHNLRVLRSPGITGGLLSGLTAVGTGSGIANDYGVEHCFAPSLVCGNAFGLTQYVSFQHPRTQTFGRTIFFRGRTYSGAPGPGWAFTSNLGTVQATRPFHRFLGQYRFETTTSLVGTEIGRTVIPMPEPSESTLLLAVAVVAGLWLVAGRTAAALVGRSR